MPDVPRRNLIQQQRLARPGWTGELNKMVKWGAVLSPQEFELAANYLSTSFSAMAAPTTPAEVGAAAFQRRCVACHEPDIVRQQRLVRAAWAREIDKMIRWGAGVTDEEREPLIDYLVGGFGPTQRGAPAR
jgi:mono/diheme cytochrome c family protein